MTAAIGRPRWIPALTMAAGLVLATAACSSGSSAAPTATGSSPSSLSSMTTAQLTAAAAKEGTVTWYTTFADSDVQPIVAAFNKAYPNITVKPLRLSAEQIPTRVITEQRGHQYSADVVSGDSPQVAQLLQAGALQPYTPKDAAPLPTGLSLPSGYEGIVYIVTTVVAWNPKVVAQDHLPVPTSVQTFTGPAWKGKFAIDPGAVNWYDSLIQSIGHDKALALLKALGANKPVFVASHTQALTDVQAGEPAGAATAYGYKAASMKKKTPAAVEFINSSPLPASLTLIDLVKNAPHPAAAALFEDWMVSQAGQAAVVSTTNHTSARSDEGNDTSVWDPSKWTPAWGNPDLAGSTYNSEVAEMNSALGAPAA
jgi:iron(III) transport system substrate-binding protein